jgi:hypothetical protein
MNIVPEIVIEERVQDEQQIRAKKILRSVEPIKNNRKRTRGRKIQYITCIVKGSFPPVFYTKKIHHVE